MVKSLEKFFVVLWVAVSLPVMLYGWITFTGPYRWVAEWEVQRFGSYDADGFPMVFGVVALPVLLLGGLAMAKQRLTGGRTRAAAAAPPRPTPKQVPARALALIGLAAIPVAAGSAWLGYQKSQQPLTFEAVNAADNRAPQTTHVDLSAVAQTDMIVDFEETTNADKRTQRYLPLTPPDWQPSQPLAYFLRPHMDGYAGPNGYLTFDPATPAFALTQRGVLFENDLPGIVEAEYQKHGITLASPYYVLDTDVSADVDIYWEVAAGAGLTGLVLLLSAALVPIAARRAKARGR